MLPIVTHPAPSLRERSKELNLSELEKPAFQSFIDDMIVTMYEDDGIGLASPQVGKNVRLFVVGKDAMKDFKMIEGHMEKAQDMAFINPVWEKTGKKTDWEVEGCLSVPKTYGKVKRHKNIRVTAYNRLGQKLVFDAHKYFARVIQHETDHIDGVLFIDKAKDIYTVDNPL